MTYELKDHTADVAIAASGEDLSEALGHAARGLSHVITGREPGRESDLEMQFTLEAPDEEALTVAFLSELLWLLESEGTLWVSGGVAIEAGGPGWILTARGNGVRYEAVLHGVGTEVKAITYHDLHIARAERTTLQVIVDI